MRVARRTTPMVGAGQKTDPEGRSSLRIENRNRGKSRDWSAQCGQVEDSIVVALTRKPATIASGSLKGPGSGSFFIAVSSLKNECWMRFQRAMDSISETLHSPRSF